MSRILVAVLVPPILAVEVAHAYLDALCRNSDSRATRLVAVAREGEVELLPVCSCCRDRALRPAGTGRICPTCDAAAPAPADMPNRRPPDETNRGV